MADLQKEYKKIDEKFLSLFEKRYIIFIEDGADLKKELDQQEDNRKNFWSHKEKRLRIDINRYRVKYDFDIAVRICPMRSGVTYNDNF